MVRPLFALLNNVLNALTEGIGVLAVLHELNLAAAFADRIYLLNGGCLVTEGPPEAVIRPEFVNSICAGQLDVRPDALTGRPLVLPGPMCMT